MDVNLKVGVDGSEYKDFLTGIKQGLKDIRDENSNLSKEITDMAEKAANSEKSFATSILNSSKELQAQQDIFRNLKKQIEENGKATGVTFKTDPIKAYNAALKESAELAKKLSQAGVKSILSPDEVKKLTAALNNTKDDFEALNVILDVTKKKLATLNPDSAEFKQLSSEVHAVELMLKQMGGASDETGQKQVTLRQRLREVTMQLADLKAQGKDSTKEYALLKQEAGELFDTLSDVKEELRQAGSDTRGFDKLIRVATAVTASFQIAQGASALFGDENEDLQKALLKVNAAMSILNGLQAIQTELTKADSLAKGLVVGAQKAWTWAINETNGSLLAMKVALLATGVGAFVVILGFAAQAMGLFGGNTSSAAKEMDKLNDEFDRLARGNQNDLDELDRKSKLIIAKMEAEGASKEAIQKQNVKNIDAEIAKRKELLEFAEVSAQMAEEAFKKDPTEETNKKRQESYDKLSKANSAYLDAVNNKEVTLYNNQKELREEKEKADKDALDKRKKRVEEEKKLNEDITKFIRDEEERRVAAIADANDREVAENINAFENEIANLQDAYKVILSTQVLNREQRKIVDESYNKQLNDIAAKYSIKALEIEKKQREDQLKIASDAAEAIAELQSTSKEQELQAIDKKYADITARLKKAGQLTVEIEKDIAARVAKEKQVVTTKYGVEDLNNQEELEIAKVGILTDSRYSPALLEEIKQQEVLKVQLKYAKLRLAALQSAGGKENELAIAQTQALINNLEKSLSDSLKNGNGIAKILGISEQEYSAIGTGVGKVVGIYQKGLEDKIAIKDKEISVLGQKIDEAQSELDREIELAKMGYANNIENKREEINQLKAQRDKDIQSQREYQKQLEKIEIAKQSAALATSVANMIQTSSQIIKSGSEQFGWVGAILAVAEAVAIVAEFQSLTAKIKNVSKMSKGGVAGGDSHDNGGNKYVSMDGKDANILEIERDEWVINKKSSKKYHKLLEAINRDNLSDWHVTSMGLVKNADVSFNDAAAAEVDHNVYIVSNSNTSNAVDSKYLSAIAENTSGILKNTEKPDVLKRIGNDLHVYKQNGDIRIIRDYYND